MIHFFVLWPINFCSMHEAYIEVHFSYLACGCPSAPAPFAKRLSLLIKPLLYLCPKTSWALFCESVPGPLLCPTHQSIYPSVTVPFKHFSYAFNSFFCNLKALPIPLPRTACFCLFFKFLLQKHLTKIKEKGNGLTHKLSCFNSQIMLIQKLNILA